MNLYLYEMTSPIDFWQGWTSLADYVGTIDRDAREERERLFGFMFRALANARFYSSRWEGDIRDQEMYVGGLPPLDGYPGCNLLLGWKQENNGDSFIASPVEIPHLAVGQIYPPPKDPAPRPD